MPERRILAVAAIVTGASIPAFLAIFGLWGAHGLAPDASADPAHVLAFAHQHPVLYALLPVTGVVMHLAALVLVVGLHPRLLARRPIVAGVAHAMGLLWVIADTLQNLMHYGIYLGADSGEAVAAAHTTGALWHAGHFGGGIWVLGIAASGAIGGRPYRMLSAFVGVVFALHSFVVPLVPAYFALELLLVPLWAFTTAFVLGRAREPRPAAASVPTALDGVAAPLASRA